MESSPISNSFDYGVYYQLEQLEKHRKRYENHWKDRIGLAHTMIDKWVLTKPRYQQSENIRTSM